MVTILRFPRTPQPQELCWSRCRAQPPSESFRNSCLTFARLSMHFHLGAKIIKERFFGTETTKSGRDHGGSLGAAPARARRKISWAEGHGPGRAVAAGAEQAAEESQVSCPATPTRHTTSRFTFYSSTPDNKHSSSPNGLSTPTAWVPGLSRRAQPLGTLVRMAVRGEWGLESRLRLPWPMRAIDNLF